MDAIKYLIGFFFKIAFAALFIALVWWLVSLLFPALSISQLKQLVSGEEQKDILPSPRAYGEMLQSIKKVQVATSTVYSHSGPFSGYKLYSGSIIHTNGSFVVYTPGVIPQEGAEYQDKEKVTGPAPERSAYIRNLSIYEGYPIYNGLTYTGIARNEMFKDGAFLVLLLDSRGVIVGVSKAIKLETWSVPGWSRFGVKISHPVPSGGVPCSLVFEQGRDQYITREPVRVGIQVKCN